MKRGFYKSYKHDPNGPLGNWIFEVLNIMHSTSRRGETYIIYRPLDPEMPVYKKGQHLDGKLVEEFLSPAEKEGKQVKRYVLITDSKEIELLTQLRDELYADMPIELNID